MPSHLQDAIRRCKKQISVSQNELRQLHNEFNSLNHEIPLLINRISTMRGRLEELPRIISSTEERLSGYESEFNRLHTKEKEYSRDHKIASLEREIERLRRRLGE